MAEHNPGEERGLRRAEPIGAPSAGQGADDWSSELAARTQRTCLACHARLGSPLQREDLDDVIQESLVAVWLHQHLCRDQKRFDSWIYGVARLCILKKLQAHARSRLVSNSDLGAAVGVEHARPSLAKSTTHLGSHVGRQVDLAGTTVAAILKGRFEEDRGFQTIATRLGLTREAVRSRYYRVLPQLRRRLEPLWRPFSGG